MLFLNQKTVTASVALTDVMDTIEKALIASEKPEDFVLPLRTNVMDEDGNILMLMPCLAEHAWGLKILTIFSGNPAQGKPYIDGMVILYDPKTGEPRTLMDGKIVTALRTGAIGGVGIRQLSKPDTHSLGLFGAGVQGYWQVRYACAARDIKDVWIHDAFPDKLSIFIDRLKEALPVVHFHIAKDPKQLLENCEAVMTATTSLTSVLPDDPALLKGHCFVGIGSFRPDMREYPDGLFKVVDEVYVDTDHALDETGDLLTPIERGLLKKESVQTIGSRLVAKKTEIPETAFYKAVGGALFDLYTADLIYKEARKKGLGTELEL